MSTLLEPGTVDSNQNAGTLSSSANQVRAEFAACRVKFRWFGTTKTLSASQKTQAAQSFGAEGKAISAAKRLIDTKHDRYRALTSLKSQIIRYWKDHSLAYPEAGTRLIKQDRIDDFNQTLRGYKEDLEVCVGLLDEHFDELRDAARIRLGSLFNISDYPVSLADEFAVEWDYPNVSVPEYLRRLNPEVYAQQAQLVSARFEETVAMAEQAFIEELESLVNHLAERLSGDEDGKPKVFRDSSLTNMAAFFHRFRELNVRSNEQLDELVDRCEQLMSGVQPQSLRDNDSLRRSLSTNLASVQSSLDQLMIERPRRNIIRPSRRSQREE
jgi:hypothetical protein